LESNTNNNVISSSKKVGTKNELTNDKNVSASEFNSLVDNNKSNVNGNSVLKSANSPKKKGRGVKFDALTSFLYMCQYGDPTEEPELPTIRKYLGIPLENGEEVKNVEIPECFKDQIPMSKEVVSNLYTPHNFLTPLHVAATYNQLGIVKLLVEYADAPVNIQDTEGWTPLHCACAEGNFDVVEYLGRCTKRRYYEKAINDKSLGNSEEISEEDNNRYKGYSNDYHIFEYSEKDPVILKKPSKDIKEVEDEEDDDSDSDGEEEEEEEEEEEKYADICEDYIPITDENYGLLMKECNSVKDTNPDKPAIYAVDGPILLDILNDDGNNVYEVCQDDPSGKIIQMHIKSKYWFYCYLNIYIYIYNIFI